MKIIKNQYLSVYDVRNMCIRENLFTCGTNEQYSAMFEMVDNLPKDCEITTQSLYDIAYVIAECSDSEKWCRATGMDYADFVAQIMYLLYEQVKTGFEILEV